MKLCEKCKLNKNNSGAALVMVIVVIGFVSIIATMLLYMTVMNFYMKTTDIKTKSSFYEGETALEQIKSSLMTTATEAFDNAYYKLNAEYASIDTQFLQGEFNHLFVDEFETLWKKTTNVADPTSLPSKDVLESYLKLQVEDKYKEGVSVVLSSPTSTTARKDLDNGYFFIQTVNFSFTDSKGYTTIISTDYIVRAPKIDFKREAVHDDAIELVEMVSYINWTKK